MQESYVVEFALPPDGLSTDADRILALTAGRPARTIPAPTLVSGCLSTICRWRGSAA